VAKLHFPSIKVDQEQTDRNVELAEEVFGDILRVRRKCPMRWSYGLTEHLIYLRGFEQVLIDLYENPQLLHDIMTFLRDETLHELDTLEREGVLTLNNGQDDVVTNGYGATDELPLPDFDGRVRLKDLWVMAEGQEFVSVGPKQFDEFALQYQLPVIQRFGLCAYGCCEPLDTKFDLLIQSIPNLRRLSVAPWADKRLAAEKIKDKYVYCWKPNPSYVCAPKPDFEAAEEDAQNTLEAAKDCHVQIMLADTATLHNEPERLTRWIEMFRSKCVK
jgi:hypothetical protein